MRKATGLALQKKVSEVSSIFDFITFGVLMFIVHATVDQIRTGWFIESVVSASFIVLSLGQSEDRYRREVKSSQLMAVFFLTNFKIGWLKNIGIGCCRGIKLTL